MVAREKRGKWPALERDKYSALQKQLQQKWVGTEEKVGDREQGGKLFLTPKNYLETKSSSRQTWNMPKRKDIPQGPTVIRTWWLVGSSFAPVQGGKETEGQQKT